MKKFNTTGVCVPTKHYMVNIDERLKKIKAMIDEGDYFVISRARQYGKTTTLTALRKYLSEDYLVISLDFLAQLRAGYIARDTKEIPAFQSVILAGVTDIRHLKSRIRDEEQVKVNSPWNIAADFKIDMSLPVDGIKGMLEEYESDYQTGMDTEKLARLLREYTEGYPFLVSRLCQLMDTEVSESFSGKEKAWTEYGMTEAVKLLLNEKNTLFESLMGKLTNYPKLKEALRHVLMEGERLVYNIDQLETEQMSMYGFVKNEKGTLKIANRIFETRLYNLFLSDEEMTSSAVCREGEAAKSIFIKDRSLNMPLVLERFIQTYTEIFGPLEDKFKEKDGREQFLLYLKPIINGTGNYYIEAQTRDARRTDVIVDYLGKQYVIELKIWHGERYNEEGEKQLREYLDYFHLDTGYMLSFNFNKKKETGVKQLAIGAKVLYEGML